MHCLKQCTFFYNSVIMGGTTGHFCCYYGPPTMDATTKDTHHAELPRITSAILRLISLFYRCILASHGYHTSGDRMAGASRVSHWTNSRAERRYCALSTPPLRSLNNQSKTPRARAGDTETKKKWIYLTKDEWMNELSVECKRNC